MSSTLTKERAKLDELIKSQLPLDMEIGFGKGAFVLGRARIYQDANIIGYEIRKKWVDRVNGIIEKEDLNNIYVEYAHAEVEIADKMPAKRLRNLFINFPDPWWKRKHKKRRILQSDFLKLFYNVLDIGSRIYIRTDVQSYANDVKGIFSQYDSFQEVEHDICGDQVMTDREVRCKEDELDIYYLAYQKIK